MSITLELQPAVEQGLSALAATKGISLVDLASSILAREAGATLPGASGSLLVDACSRAAGILSDEEIDALSRLSRRPSNAIELE